MSTSGSQEQFNGLEIAIIGMSLRFPGARDAEGFWRNLRDGVESITFFGDEELLAAGIDPALLRRSNFVKAYGALDGIEFFDAAFFGYTPREATIMDPQHRLFLECAWEALEHAGYDPETYAGSIGVFGGSGINSYVNNIFANSELLATIDWFQAGIGNDKDFLTTRVSYKLNLKGPSVVVQSACSTSLVATHVACQNLLSGACDIALAGGVTIVAQQKRGYLFQEGGISSPDGHCRAFDAQARGTVGGSGVGVVVLKRLEDALADGDEIHAVIKGSAINNDGSVKVGYTAPSVGGQAEVIRMAHAIAGVEPETITYVEAHGTATELGDPIEIAALTDVFGSATRERNFCAVGSVKTNFGHLDTAAGVAGLIKTALALEHKTIPPSLHFREPNPRINFADSPFYVSAQRAVWEKGQTARRAGVSSFGIGGTNAHVVLEEAPEIVPHESPRAWQLLLLSARTDTALTAMTSNLSRHLTEHSEIRLDDVAYTLQVGRKTFGQRRMLVCRGPRDAVDVLEGRDPARVQTSVVATGSQPPVAFMFPGQGAQYVNMGRELYEAEGAFREWLDECADILRPYLGLDLRRVLYPDESGVEAAAEQLKQTFITQPALFAVEYALARLWLGWGVRPRAMVGHSVGEYVAACLAGVFSLEDALKVVAARGRLMQSLPAGAMVAVPLPEDEVRPLLDARLSLAAVNTPSSCVVSGPTDAVEQFEQRLAEEGKVCRRLQVSHAFHSGMTDPVLKPFVEVFKNVKLKPPQLPYLSNVSGQWIRSSEATDPNYWATHLRGTVQFAAAGALLVSEPGSVLLEVGPGRALSSFVRQHTHTNAGHTLLSSLRHADERRSDVEFLLSALGRLWLSNVKIDWAGFYDGEKRRRVHLPTYPFERKKFWVKPSAVDKRNSRESFGGGDASLESPRVESESAAVAARSNGEETEAVLENIIAQQLSVMSRQVELLRGGEADEGETVYV
jgi:acyl transferase domain-containing protein